MKSERFELNDLLISNYPSNLFPLVSWICYKFDFLNIDYNFVIYSFIPLIITFPIIGLLSSGMIKPKFYGDDGYDGDKIFSVDLIPAVLAMINVVCTVFLLLIGVLLIIIFLEYLFI